MHFAGIVQSDLQKRNLNIKYITIVLNLQVHIKKKYVTKKVNIFCYSFQKVKPIYYMDSLHIE